MVIASMQTKQLKESQVRKFKMSYDNGRGGMKDGEGPHKMEDVDMAFGPRDVYSHLPGYKPEFYRLDNPWGKIASTWFRDGLPKGVKFHPKPGINAQDAFRHIRDVMGSFEPKHEHKIAGCAYLMSIWFERVEFPGEVKDDPS